MLLYPMQMAARYSCLRGQWADYWWGEVADIDCKAHLDDGSGRSLALCGSGVEPCFEVLWDAEVADGGACAIDYWNDWRVLIRDGKRELENVGISVSCRAPDWVESAP